MLSIVKDTEKICRFDDGSHGACGGPSNGRECWDHKKCWESEHCTNH